MKTLRLLGLGSVVPAALLAVACDSEVVHPAGTGGQGATATGQGGGGSAQGGGTQGGAGPCLAATGDYGDCEMALGWAFDGADCVPMSGCGCGPDCAAFSEDLESCIAGCAGFCDEAAFLGAGIAADDWGEGDFCDGIHTCVSPDVEPLLAAMLTSVDCSGGTGGCPVGQVRCTLALAGEVSPSQAAELCSATLIQDLDAIYCSVIGP